MCWSKSSSPNDGDKSNARVTTLTPTTFFVNTTTAVFEEIHCQDPAIECSEEYCNYYGKCCQLESDNKYCACFADRRGKFCEGKKILESQEANTINVTVGVIVFIVLALLAFVLIFVVIRIRRKTRLNRQTKSETVELNDNNNGNSMNGSVQVKMKKTVEDYKDGKHPTIPDEDTSSNNIK